ncbi:MAG: hypothetical protein CMJ78_01560 [Planctomycetaceae bacterium]|nr:hypothetical protein [Planctomycetaceae bacterium]
MPFQDYRFLSAILAIAAILFCAGAFGFLTRHRIIGLTSMFFSAALTMAAFGEFHGSTSAMIFACISIVTAGIRIAAIAADDYQPAEVQSAEDAKLKPEQDCDKSSPSEVTAPSTEEFPAQSESSSDGDAL